MQVETLGSTSKKKKKNNDHSDQLERCNVTLEKHREHVLKLETLLRMLDNDNVNIEQVGMMID